MTERRSRKGAAGAGAAAPPIRHLSTSRQVLFVGVLGLVVLALVVAESWIGASSAPKPAETAQATGSFRPTDRQWAGLTISTVADAAFRSVDVTDGKIATDGDLATPIFSPYSGRVTRLIAKLGDVVQQGQPLFAINAVEFVQGENDLMTAEANAQSARLQLDVARTNEQRQHALYDSKAGALKDWQQAQSDLAGAVATEKTAATALAAVQNRLRILGKSDKEVTALESADRITAEVLVRAPIAGTVIDRQIGPGQYIQSGAATPQYTIADLSTLWLVANVREVDASAIRVGDPIEVHVLAYPGRSFRASLGYVAPSIDPTSRRLAVRAEIANPDGALKPEMFASFTIATSADVTAPGIPAESVVYEGDSARVWVAHPDRSIELRNVRTGRSAAGLVEILAGLVPGEKVVSRGALFIDRAASSD